MLDELQELYERNIDLLERAGVEFAEFVHEPVLDYDTAAEIRRRFGLTGTETKNLFLKLKTGGYAMLVTLENKRADLEAIKTVLGSVVSIATPYELSDETGCLPNCAVPLGHWKQIALIVDREVLRQPRLIFSPGPPERTIEIESDALEKILATVDNRVVYL